MEHLSFKISLVATCPHCNDKDCHTFYLNAESLICDKCDKEFQIEIWASNLQIKTSK